MVAKRGASSAFKGPCPQLTMMMATTGRRVALA
jgi:hypothetical protein